MLDAITTLLSRVRALFRRGAAERELNDELAFHIEMETRKNIDAGMSERDARRRALVSFGGVDAHKESLRDTRSFRWLEDALSDARYALRWLGRVRGFTVVAVLTLGLGIGATTAIFTVVNAVLLRPLPYADADELAIIYGRNPERGGTNVNISYEDYRSWKREVGAFERLGVFNWVSNTIGGDDAPAERLAGGMIDADLFPALGVEPLLGRGVLPEEVVAGREGVVLIGYGLWQRRYGGERSVLGRTITVNGQPHVVIGVMPPRFQFPYAAEVWRPMAPDEDYANRSTRVLAGAVGRLREGVPRAQAEAELARVSQALEREFPESNTGWEAQYVPLREDLFGALRPAMLIVFAAAGLVLLIVCGNLANLLLARSAGRSREIALRTALGAGRSRLVRQFMTESVVLAALGGVLGLVVAYWGVGVLRGMLVDRIPAFIHITPDLRVYAFAAAATAGVALLAGILPALRGSHVDAQAVVKEGGRSTSGTRGSRLRGALVVSEVALTVVLLVGAALLIKSMAALTRIDPGFDAMNVLTARYSLPSVKYDAPERWSAFQAVLLERLRAEPGVIRVGAVQGTPFSGWNVRTSYAVEGEPPAPAGRAPSTHFQSVTPEYFDVLGVPLVRGRMIDHTDGRDAPAVAVVNESFVARHFQSQDPTGKRFRLCCGDERPWITVAGVVADYRHFDLTEPMSAAVYLPYAQHTRSQMTLAIRTAGNAADMIPALRRILAELDPDIPADRVQTLEEVIARQTWVQRIARDILAAFAATAALLALIGLYGLISYSVAQQRHEIGIRLALGAAPRRVLRLVVRKGMTLALAGIAIGSAVAFLTTRLLSQLLFEVEPADSGTFLIVPLAVATLAAAAAAIPARLAASTDPMITLRAE
jgi:putative ABC transport system permease protein